MQGKALLTQEGIEKLREELEYLKTTRRREVAEAIQSAKEQGDLSENAEYVAAKETHHQLEQRIVEIEELMKHAEVIQKKNGDKVEVGDTVTVEIAGTERAFTIVGPNEADPPSGRISYESPLASSMLGKRAGEIAQMRTPTNGVQEIKIVKID